MALQAIQAQRARLTTQVCPGRLVHQLQHPACKHVYAVTVSYNKQSSLLWTGGSCTVAERHTNARQSVGVLARKGLVLSWS